MTQGFQQQALWLGVNVPRSVATPQHGQKAAPKVAPMQGSRSFQPRSGH